MPTIFIIVAYKKRLLGIKKLMRSIKQDQRVHCSLKVYET